MTALLLLLVVSLALSYLVHVCLQLISVENGIKENALWRADITQSLPITVWTARKGEMIELLNSGELGLDKPRAGESRLPWTEAIHSQDRAGFLESWQAATSSSVEFRRFFRLSRKDGSCRWSYCHGRVSDVGTDTWYGTILDVDDDRKAQQELAEFAGNIESAIADGIAKLQASEGRFQALFQDMNIAYSGQRIGTAKKMIDAIKSEGVTDFWGYVRENPDFVDRCLATITVSMVNDVLIRMMGYRDHDELVALPPTSNAVDARSVMSLQLEAMFDERRQFTLFTVLTGKNDLRTPVAVGVNVTADWSTCMSTLVDISELQHANEMVLAAQEELAKANKAATVGAVSASIAHELNQPIAASLLDAENALKAIDDHAKPDHALILVDRVVRNAERMKAIVERTREQVEKRRRPPSLLDLNGVIEETATLLANDLKNRDTTLVVTLSPTPATIFAEHSEVQQVIVNLLTNAAEAIHGGSKRGTVSVMVTGSADECRVVVEDDGPGLADDGFEYLFNAFYSTKAGGMGMGLHICRSIVSSLGGTLIAENRVHGGARFVVTLPPGELSLLKIASPPISTS